MSNQEGTFYPQEQQPQNQRPPFEKSIPEETRPIEEEDSTWQAPVRDPHAGYEEGYIGASYTEHTQREKIQPQQSRKWKPNATFILLLILTLLIIVTTVKFPGVNFFLITPFFIIVAIRNFNRKNRQQPANIEHSARFVVDGKAMLVLDNRAGNITIKRGAGYSVEIKSTQVSNGRFGKTENIQSYYQQHEDKIIVKEQHWSRAAWSQTSINYEILLPEQSEIRIAQNAGNVDIEGITGQVSVSMNGGNVNLKGMKLRGQSLVAINGGNISIHGKLENGARTTLRSNAGNIDVALPTDSKFQFNGHTTIGNVENQFGWQALGETPNTLLEAYTNAGSIHIWKS